MGTLIEEIFSRKAGRPVQAGEILLLDVDYIMSHDNTTPLAIKAFRDIGKPIHDKNRIVLHLDHAYPAPNVLAAENHKKIIEFVKEQGSAALFSSGRLSSGDARRRFHYAWRNRHRRGLALEHLRRDGRIRRGTWLNGNRRGMGDRQMLVQSA